MKKHSIALVTAAAARDLDDDLPPLVEAMQKQDAQTHVVNWDDSSVDWSTFDVAVLRSTWDYTQRLQEFLQWADRAAAQTRLLNPAQVVRWNTDKHYLRDLARANVAIVPSEFVETDADAGRSLEQFLRSADGDEFVVKPAIGAGSRDAQRYGREETAQAIAHIERLIGAQRSVVLQPYLGRVDERGETALIFFDGVFSHAIRKGPLLKRGEGPTRALFAAEHIAARTPTAAERDLAQRALDAIPFPKPLLYARVDLIEDADGTPRVLELELTEPSLFFAHAAGSADRFAQRIFASAR